MPDPSDLTGFEADIVELLTGVYVIAKDDYDPADERPDFLRKLIAWRDAAVTAETGRLRAQVEDLESRLTDAENMVERLTP